MSPPLIPSKFFLAPINTGFAEHGRPTPKLLEFHRQRSGNGIGVSYVGNVAVDPRYVTNSSTLYLGDDLGSWVELAGTIRERGSLPALQLACRLPGRVARRTWTVPNKAEYVAHCQAVLRTLDVSDFERVIEMFARAATASARAGFEIIQVHAAHGYFLSQLLSPTVCPADLAVEPLPFVLRLLAVVAESAPSALIDIRISILEGLHTGEREAKETIVRQLQLGRVDLISISNGLYEVRTSSDLPE